MAESATPSTGRDNSNQFLGPSVRTTQPSRREPPPNEENKAMWHAREALYEQVSLEYFRSRPLRRRLGALSKDLRDYEASECLDQIALARERHLERFATGKPSTLRPGMERDSFDTRKLLLDEAFSKKVEDLREFMKGKGYHV